MFNNVQTVSGDALFSRGSCKGSLNGIGLFSAVRSAANVKTAPFRLNNLAARVQTQNGPETLVAQCPGPTADRIGGDHGLR